MSNEEEILVPRGLVYVPDFVAPEIAAQLEAELTADKRWTPVSSKAAAEDGGGSGVGAAPARCVIQYGYRYNYAGSQSIATAAIDPIPAAYAQLVAHLGASARPFEQLIINRYLPGQGIGPHVDDVHLFGPVVACITLGSGCDIIFTRGESVTRRYVAPRSLYMMTGDARYQWRHQIAPVKSDVIAGHRVPRGIRYSLTFRTMNGLPAPDPAPKNEEDGP